MNSLTTASATHDEVGREHQELRQLIDSISERFNTDSAGSEALSGLLGELAQRLAAHFATEEHDSGLYAQILDVDARFGPTIKQLSAEHVLLLKEAQDLASNAIDWERCKKLFKQLREALEKHESCENQLIQQAYTDDIGSKD